MGFWRRLFGGGEYRSTVSAHPRDPVIAEWWGGGSRTSAGMSVTPDSAMQSAAVYACVKLLANAVAALPLNVYRRTDDEERERDRSHPLSAILSERPNKWQTPFQFRQMLVTHLVLRGKGYAEIVSTRGRAVDQLIPLHPDRVRPFQAPDGKVAFEYRPTNGPARIILQDEMFHVADLTTGDGFTGIGAIQLHRETIGLDIAAREYGARFFGNNASPKGGIKLPQVVGDEAARQLRESWERRHKGPENAHRIAILDGGMEWFSVGMTNEDAQFLETRRYQVSDIARIFGVPPHMIGETDKSTSWGTGIEQQTIGFITFVLGPWLALFEQAAMRDLLTTPETHFVEFNIDGLLRGDFKTRMEGFQIMINGSIAAPNEIRRKLNLPPMPGGDRRLQQVNMAQVGEDGNVILPPKSQAPAEPPAQEPQNV